MTNRVFAVSTAVVWVGLTLWAFVPRCIAWPGAGPPPPELDEERLVERALQGDRLLTYRDGTPLGTLTRSNHRLVASYEDLPLTWLVAIVASEDERFWSHPGVDLPGILRAARDNLAAGRIVAGGSSLSQQTVKMLVERSERSLEWKLQELDYAAHLEQEFDKTHIITLYANLVHVDGTGKGVGIAARYFFDTDLRDLSLLQSAFIAGMVQAPEAFDPFEGDVQEREARRERARERTRYVLGRIAASDLGHLSPPGHDRARVVALREEAERLLGSQLELPFRRGEFRHGRNVLIDDVERRIDSLDLEARLADADLERGNIVVETTLDVAVQREATYGLWHQLTELGLELERPRLESVLNTAARSDLLPEEDVVERHRFYRGRVVETTGPTTVAIADGHCTLDRAGLRRIGRRTDPRRSVADIREELREGLALWVSLRDGEHCDLEWVPELQGAAVVLENGQIRGQVGGNVNRDFDRTHAPRQFGSAFKPLVFQAAFDLGWRPSQVLANAPTRFELSTTIYEPQKGHRAPDVVSIRRAATQSENVASVWLLVHLLDRLDTAGLWSLMEDLDLARREDETRAAYAERLRELGLDPRDVDIPDVSRHAALVALYERHPEESAGLSTAIALDGWWAVHERSRRCRQEARRLLDRSPGDGAARWLPQAPHSLYLLEERGRRSLYCESVSGATPLSELVEDDVHDIAAGFEPSKVRLANGARIGTVEALGEQAWGLRRAMEQGEHDVLDPEVLYHDPEFRTFAALRYVIELARQYGVQSDLAPVLSLPLGSNELTLHELTMLYEGLVSGRSIGAGEGVNQLIAEVRAEGGQRVHRPIPRVRRVVDPSVAEATASLLRGVVAHGTGRRARDAVVVSGQRVPLGGKTGTTDDYRNAAFVGYRPGPADGGHAPEEGVVVGVYVGYDDNRAMTTGDRGVTGSRGALPAWAEIVSNLPMEDLQRPPPSDEPP